VRSPVPVLHRPGPGELVPPRAGRVAYCARLPGLDDSLEDRPCRATDPLSGRGAAGSSTWATWIVLGCGDPPLENISFIGYEVAMQRLLAATPTHRRDRPGRRCTTRAFPPPRSIVLGTPRCPTRLPRSNPCRYPRRTRACRGITNREPPGRILRHYLSHLAPCKTPRRVVPSRVSPE